MTTAEKLAALREHMLANQCDYYYIPSTDPHLDEYVPEVWQRRAWISGFTGSAGDVLVGMDKAYLWTDGRYTLQAEAQLDFACFDLMPQVQGVASPIHQWLQACRSVRVGVDPKVMSIAQMDRFEEALMDNDGELVPIDDNLVDLARGVVCELPESSVSLWPVEHAGMSVSDKIGHVQQYLTELGCDALALNVLDQIAWLFNIRGADIAYNPVCISYAVVTPDAAHWFVSAAKITAEVQAYCQQNGIQLHDYSALPELLASIRGVVLMDPESATWWMLQQITDAEIAMAAPIIDMMKACKNPIEQAGMQEAHRLDGLALVRFFYWLSTHWQAGVTELSASKQLAVFRQSCEDCVGLSFETISGFADHGAIIHYAVNEETDRPIDDSNLYLVDSGGQYLQGTTDVTRTLHLGEPTKEQRRLYTAVLRGHVALSKLKFPHSTSGSNLDTIARQFLWQQQWDYAHGTGHGVGCYLCVHEGPHRVSRSGPASQLALVPGMIISNEPGVYWPGHFGIRIENLCLVTECEGVTAHGEAYYQLQTLTLAPYERRLIDVASLDADEVQWINAYHRRVYDTLSPDLGESERAWLQVATAPL